MTIVLFEDYDYDNFYPLSLTRPVFHLRFGVGTLEDRFRFYFPTVSFSYIIRDELKEVYSDLPLIDFVSGEGIIEDEDYLFILSNLLLDKALNIGSNEVLLIDDKPVAFKLDGSRVRHLSLELFFKEGSLLSFLKASNLSFIPLDLSVRVLNYLFDLVAFNGAALVNAFSIGDYGTGEVLDDSSVMVVGNREDLFLARDVKVYPFVCFVLENGPVFVDEAASIMPFSVIEGPCYIGSGSVVEGARIRGGTSIGNVCKIGGEVESSIIMDYTNKHHDGFLGNSYLGSFVNLGAMSTTSDLKNNYGRVIISLKDSHINTHSIKVGSFIGDHSKLGIGSLLNTGTVIGIACNLYCSGLMYPKYVPSFVWGSNYPFHEYIFERFIKTAELVLGRRAQVLTEEYVELLKSIFFSEQKSRKDFLNKIS